MFLVGSLGKLLQLLHQIVLAGGSRACLSIFWLRYFYFREGALCFFLESAPINAACAFSTSGATLISENVLLKSVCFSGN